MEDLEDRKYRLIDETGFEYNDVCEVDLDEGLVTIYLRGSYGHFYHQFDEKGNLLGLAKKTLKIDKKMKLIPEELLTDARKG